MKSLEITVLDEHDEKYADLLVASGVSPSMARVIVCLMIRSGATIREIGMATGLTTTAVSTALKGLRERGMVRADHKNKPKKTESHYRLVGDWKCILTLIEEHNRREVTGYVEKTGRVKSEFREKFRNSPV